MVVLIQHFIRTGQNFGSRAGARSAVSVVVVVVAAAAATTLGRAGLGGERPTAAAAKGWKSAGKALGEGEGGGRRQSREKQCGNSTAAAAGGVFHYVLYGNEQAEDRLSYATGKVINIAEAGQPQD